MAQVVDWNLVAQLSQPAATLVAVVALIVSFLAERRNQRRFDQQMEESRLLAHANVRPLLALTRSGYLDHKALHLVNHGIGAAVVTKVRFERGGRTALSVPDVVELSGNVVWDDYTEYSEDGIFYIPAGGAETLIELTQDNLEQQQHMGEFDAAQLLAALEAQLDEVKVVLTYQDVLDEVIGEDEELS